MMWIQIPTLMSSTLNSFIFIFVMYLKPQNIMIHETLIVFLVNTDQNKTKIQEIKER